jgi:hypothetical protein
MVKIVKRLTEATKIIADKSGRQKSDRLTRRFAASGAITRIKGNAKRVNLSFVARELSAPPDGKPRNTLHATEAHESLNQKYIRKNRIL